MRGGAFGDVAILRPRAIDAPRAQADDASQNPQIRKAGMIASFVFELDA